MVQDVTERRKAELKLRATEKRWESVFKNSPVPGVVTAAKTGTCLAANEEFLEWIGKPAEEVVGRTMLELKFWMNAEQRAQAVARVEEKGYLRHFELRLNVAKGQRTVLMNVEPVDIDDEACYLATFIDITERNALEQELKLTAAAVEQAAEAMVILDHKGNIVSLNPAFTRITGYEKDEVTGKSMSGLLHWPTGKHDDSFFRALTGRLLMSGHWEGEVWAQRKSGEQFPELLSISAIRNGANEITHYVGVFNDISGQKDHEEKLRKRALYDPLTGLPNRFLLLDHMEKAIERASRRQSKLAVCFMDLDHFKPVNDTHGHETGDQLLKQIAVRLLQTLRKSDFVARLGGDEFVLVLEDIDGVAQVERVADKVVNAMHEPFALNDITVEIGCSIGVALYPNHAERAKTLLRYADEALYETKEAGRDGYRVSQR